MLYAGLRPQQELILARANVDDALGYSDERVTALLGHQCRRLSGERGNTGDVILQHELELASLRDLVVEILQNLDSLCIIVDLDLVQERVKLQPF